ncbi:MAG: hypothetical protein QXI60_05625 [Thermofilaceae archaeon]
MTLAELRAWIRRQARDVYATEVTDAQLNDLLNEGYIDFAARTGCFIRDVSVSVNANTNIVTFPSYVIDFKRITQGNAVLLTATPEDMAIKYGASWRSQTGTPAYVIRLSPTAVRPVPIPSAAQSWTVEAIVVPSNETGAPIPLLSSDNDTPLIPAAFHLALAYYAIWQLALMNPQNQLLAARAQGYMTNYVELIGQARQELGRMLEGVSLKPMVQPASSQQSQ